MTQLATHRAPAERPGETPSDGSLLRRFRGGSEDAATQLYRRYAHRLRALARAKCSAQLARRVDAEDIVQSVFRTFFHGASQGCYDVPDGDDLWNLLLVIALNKIRAEGAFHQAAKRDVRLTAPIDFSEASEETAARQDDFAEAFLQLAVRDALDQLTEQHRRMVELRVEGHEVADIARLTGRSKRTVERVLQEARQKLRGLLEKED